MNNDFKTQHIYYLTLPVDPGFKRKIMSEDVNCLKEQVSLKEFFTSIIREGDKRFEDRYTSLEKLINKNSQEAKEAVKSALDAQEKAVNAALAAAEKAVQKAEIAAEKRFDNFAENYTKNLDRISIDLKTLSEAKSGSEGKEVGVKSLANAITSGIALIIAAAAMILGFFGK